MARTITIDGAQLHEVRIVMTPLGKTAVQASFSLLAGTTIVKQVNLRDFTADLEAAELSAANAVLTALNGALTRLEVS